MKTVVLIPCYNEELTIEKVISDFKRELPEAEIYVYDNNSDDNTAELAKKAGAIVRREKRQGKGNVVRSMFRDIDADIYVMADGDDTYPADEVHRLIQPVQCREADMVIGDRLSNGTYTHENKRHFHDFGNNLVRNLINRLFHSDVHDIMTGYRVFNRFFVKTMPVMSEGFQIETEMTIFALVYRFKLAEIPITYRDRPEGSFSKLNTFKDGFRVLVTLFDLYKDNRPFYFFSGGALFFSMIGLFIGFPAIWEFLKFHFVFKVPSAILAASLFIIAFILLILGIILDSLSNRSRKEFEYQLNQYLEKNHLK